MLRPGELVDGRYAVRDRIAKGGMGSVYRAEDVVLRRPTALKRLNPDRATERDAHRLYREAAALASLRHDNVAAVYTAGIHAGAPFVAMELVQGASLGVIHDEHVLRRQSVPLSRALTILESIARALAAVHQAGLVHRDVKPDNVVVEEGTGRVVLVDFGLAIGSEPHAEDTISGTPVYVAPELCNPPLARPTAASDLYALGCVAMELLTGDPPFAHESPWEVFRMHAQKPAPRPSERRPELVMVDDLLGRLLEKSPERRPGTANAVVRELAAIADAVQTVARPTVPTTAVVEESGMLEIPRFAELRVLVVDDDPVAARIAARAAQIAFAGHPVEVSRVGSASAAIASAARRAPDLILLDYLLPDANGFDLLAHLRHQKLAPEAHVVVVSGLTHDDERWRFRILGVDDFVEKPIALDALVEHLARIGDRRGWAREPGVTSTGH